MTGVLFLITHVTSVAALILYAPVLNDVDYVTGPGADTRVLLGGLLEVICAMAIIGTAVTLFPVAKRRNEGIALGYVGLRTLEASIICAGIVTLLGVVTLRLHPPAGTNPAALVTAARTLVAVHNWTFLFGPDFVLGTNTALIAYLMYRARLVPRVIPILGLVGGPLVFAGALGTLFGAYTQVSPVAALTAVPVAAWELSFALWLIIKGFRRESLDQLGA
jgi:hypothetical protein